MRGVVPKGGTWWGSNCRGYIMGEGVPLVRGTWWNGVLMEGGTWRGVGLFGRGRGGGRGGNVWVANELWYLLFS